MLTFGQLATLADARQLNQFKTPRHLILELTAMVGLLASSFLQHAPLDKPRTELSSASSSPTRPTKTPPVTPDRKSRTTTATPPLSPASPTSSSSSLLWRPPVEIRLLLGQILFQLAIIASSCRLNLHKCIVAKLQLNEKKYPVDLCKGKSVKYTAYSDQTGITKTVGQDTAATVQVSHGSSNSSSTDTYNDDPQRDRTEVGAIQTAISKFADERSWERFHTPRNLVLALIGELGELAELYQWKGDVDVGDTTNNNNNDEERHSTSATKMEEEEANRIKELEKVGQEIADVAIYLLRLATVCRIKIAEYTVEACATMARK